MANLTPAQIAEVKAKGFLRNRGTDRFSGRIVPRGTVFSAEELQAVADLAKKYGNGKIAFTSRLTAEIIGIPFESIPAAISEAQANGLFFGGTGSKIRPVTACKGTTCVFGNFDTQALAEKIHDAYYLGWKDVPLPHKFKIAVGGCPNSCMKPSLNDFGIEGRRAPRFLSDACKGCKVCQIEKVCPLKAASLQEGKLFIDEELCKTCGVCLGKCPFGAVPEHNETLYQIYVGGTWGKTTRMGTPLSRLVAEEEVLPLLEKTLLWFKENAYQKERLGKAIDRLGKDALEKALFSDDLLLHKEEILSKEILQR